MNGLRGAVPFEVEGESLFLRLTTNAQIRYEDAAGETVIEALLGILGTADPKATPAERLAAERGVTRRLRRLFWAGLSHMDGMTEDRAGDLIDALGRQQAGTLIGDAIKAAMPELAEGNAPKAAKKAAKAPSDT